MRKIANIQDFIGLQARLQENMQTKTPTIIIPAGTCAQASGANGLIRVTKKEILNLEPFERLNLRITGCHGYCQMEPSVLIEPWGIFYPQVSLKDMVRIIHATLRGDLLEDLLYHDPISQAVIPKQKDIPFFARQTRNLISRNEGVDPIRIYNYIERGGYLPFVTMLKDREPSWVIDQVKASGLRGRGGAGFPTGLKWEMLAEQPDHRGKVLVCNADEGDPGAYMDRSLLEGNPHSIIEGMLIGGYATGADQGFIYVRSEYPLAIKHLVIALRQARDLGLLGRDILGSGFSFDIQLVRGAGAFVCGEETALMRSIEGKMGEPRQRPPYPVEKGIFGKPTAINNVETWANIPIILEKGAGNFAKIGTKNNSGTKIFSLVGKVRNTGLVEVPMGTSIAEIIYGIGGGPSGKAKIKAVQTGGPSGGCIPTELFDLPIDYDSLSRAGSIMGSGGMIVMDENTCMVDVAKYFMNFLQDESCGKCFTCRKGTQRMHEILEDISKGNGTMAKLELLEQLAMVVKDTSMCGLGQSAPNPVLSTLRYFRHEYEEHITKKYCTAFVCRDLVGAPCQTACPLGTEAWRYVAHIAKGEYKEAYLAIRETNPFPSVCARVCNHPCQQHCRLGATGDEPVAIRALKRFITDHIDPAIYRSIPKDGSSRDGKVAVIGAGPAGLTAAHYLSLQGYKVTVIEAFDKPGGMLVCGIPRYRLPVEIMEKEIQSLLNDNIELRLNTVLGRDLGLQDLFSQGFKAVFLALGAHRSRKLNIDGEGAEGVIPSMEYLRNLNLKGENLAWGKVGVIGGGNSAIDSARAALRQGEVDSVTIFYRRTRNEMPAYEEEIEDALAEGIELVTLVSPMRIVTQQGKLAGIEFIKNTLGDFDSSGRRRPVPAEGTEYTVNLDTLIVAIGEQPGVIDISNLGVKTSRGGTILVDKETLQTDIQGIFAGGDAVTGPNTVVDAIAAGKKAALMIDRYLSGEELVQPAELSRPSRLVEPLDLSEDERAAIRERRPARLEASKRINSFDEVELCFGEEDAVAEARRCLRCDLEFTLKSGHETLELKGEKI